MTRAISTIAASIIVLSLVAVLLFTNHTQASPSAIPAPAIDDTLATTSSQQTIVVSGGCFWGIQAVFEHVKGVTSATAGYAGGTAQTADYETVSSGDTGHAESVKVVYDPSKITLGANSASILLRGPRSHAAQSPRPRLRHAIPFRNFLHDRKSKENRRSLHQAIESSECVQRANRDAAKFQFRFLRRGRLSPGLCHQASQQPVYND